MLEASANVSGLRPATGGSMEGDKRWEELFASLHFCANVIFFNYRHSWTDTLFMTKNYHLEERRVQHPTMELILSMPRIHLYPNEEEKGRKRRKEKAEK